MRRKRLVGAVLISGSVFLGAIYTYLLFFTPYDVQATVLKLTVYFSVLAVLILLVVLGYTLLKTTIIPPDEVEREISGVQLT